MAACLKRTIFLQPVCCRHLKYSYKVLASLRKLCTTKRDNNDDLISKEVQGFVKAQAKLSQINSKLDHQV